MQVDVNRLTSELAARNFVTVRLVRSEKRVTKLGKTFAERLCKLADPKEQSKKLHTEMSRAKNIVLD